MDEKIEAHDSAVCGFNPMNEEIKAHLFSTSRVQLNE